MKLVCVFCLSAYFFGLALAGVQEQETPPAEAQARFEKRINELMLWRLSDELGLKPQEEIKLKAILTQYQDQRKAALLGQEKALESMRDFEKKDAGDSVCKTCLSDYERALGALSNANAKEFKELKALLGEKKFQTFLLVRNQMTQDVREALRQPATPAALTSKPGSKNSPKSE